MKKEFSEKTQSQGCAESKRKNIAFGVCPQMRRAKSIFYYRWVQYKGYRRVSFVFEEGGGCCL